MLIAEHPGHWLNFVNRADNRGLTTEQQRVKYLKEQLLFEQFMSSQIQQRLMQQQALSGGAPAKPVIEPIPAGCIQFVVNTTEGTYFEFSAASNTNDFTYTVTWGDGETGEGSSGEGSALISHTYPDGVADYTVRVCFDDASVIHDINFPGFD